MVTISNAEKLEQGNDHLALPFAWRSLQGTPDPESIWEKVNSADAGTISSHVDVFAQAVKALAKQLNITPEQAAWVLIETYFARLG